MLLVYRPQMQVPLHLYKGKNIFLDEDKDPYCLTKESSVEHGRFDVSNP